MELDKAVKESGMPEAGASEFNKALVTAGILFYGFSLAFAVFVLGLFISVPGETVVLEIIMFFVRTVALMALLVLAIVIQLRKKFSVLLFIQIVFAELITPVTMAAHWGTSEYVPAAAIHLTVLSLFLAYAIYVYRKISSLKARSWFGL